MKPSSGTYALVLASTSAQAVRIGKLGLLQIRCGYYVYVGSAFGPGGLKARIGHHQRISHRPRWHIDYLRLATGIEEIWYTHDRMRHEHRWAAILAEMRSVIIPCPGFGSSDCSCQSHLYFFKSKPSGNYFRRRLHARLPGHDRIIIKTREK
jgi:Uri superfamily endonuclease